MKFFFLSLLCSLSSALFAQSDYNYSSKYEFEYSEIFLSEEASITKEDFTAILDEITSIKASHFKYRQVYFDLSEEEVKMKASEFSEKYKVKKIRPKKLYVSTFKSKEFPDLEFTGIFNKKYELKYLGFNGAYVPISLNYYVGQDLSYGSQISSNRNLPQELPPESEDGACYARGLIQDQYEEQEIRVKLKEGTTRLKILDPVYEEVTIKVFNVIENDDCESSLIDSLKTKITISEAESLIEKRKAEYEFFDERIETAPSSTKWVKKKADRNCLSADPKDCLVWCLQETPAEYRTVTTSEKLPCKKGWDEIGADCTRRISKPAKYDYILDSIAVDKLISQCPDVKVEPHNITKRINIEPQLVDTIAVSATYDTIRRRTLVKAGGFTKWVEVLCEDDIDERLYSRLSQELSLRGYETGSEAEYPNPKTKAALIKFQKDNGLPIGQMDFETLEALGLLQE